VKYFVKAEIICRDRFECPMIDGVLPQLQLDLLLYVCLLCVSLPAGTHWAAYFYRRVAERKENLLFALSSIFSR